MTYDRSIRTALTVVRAKERRPSAALPPPNHVRRPRTAHQRDLFCAHVNLVPCAQYMLGSCCTSAAPRAHYTLDPNPHPLFASDPPQNHLPCSMLERRTHHPTPPQSSLRSQLHVTFCSLLPPISQPLPNCHCPCTPHTSMTMNRRASTSTTRKAAIRSNKK
jgi:hypothetical protein